MYVKKSSQYIIGSDVEYGIVREDGELEIAFKKITVASDNIRGGQLFII